MFMKLIFICGRSGIAPATPQRRVGTGATAPTQLTCCPADWRKNPGCWRSPALSSSSTCSTCRAWASSWSRSDLSLQHAGLCPRETLLHTCSLLYCHHVLYCSLYTGLFLLLVLVIVNYSSNISRLVYTIFNFIIYYRWSSRSVPFPLLY